MFKKSLLILTLSSSIFAANEIYKEEQDSNGTSLTKKTAVSKTEKYQFFANNLETKNNIITASGDVVIISKSYYMTAQRVIYDKENETFELFDQVVVLKDNNVHSNSNYSFIDMKSGDFSQTPTLLLSNKSLLWINSTKSSKKEEIIKLQESVLSSCNCNEPDWSIDFSSANYDTKSQWIETYNNKILIGSTPVFYVPYLAFPTDDTRRSGLLMPTIGQSSTDGFFLSQPMYFAPREDYDIELVPQIRSNRGKGIYSYLRYADSPYSTLYFGVGVFQENNDYFVDNNLKNKNHYGYNILYERGNVFSRKNDHQDGLYINIDWINDIEYKNLEDDNHKESYEKKIESKVNYFYNTPEYYTGAYFTYYLDTSLNSNNATMQKLPQAQFHTYSKPVLFDKLLYSTDTMYTNYNRKEGANADQLDLTLPLTYTYFLFDDYLRVTLKNTTTLTRLNYSNTISSFKDGTFIENQSVLTLGSDLTKVHEDFIHTINFKTDFVLPKTLTKSGDLHGITTKDQELEPFAVSQTKKTIDFSLNHSFYDRDDLMQIINHKIKQSVIYDDFDTKFSDLENEITFNHILGNITNRVVYSQEDNEFTESSSGLNVEYKGYFFNATHYASKDTANSGKENLESYTLKAGVKFLDDYTLTYEQDYNIQKHLVSKDTYSLGIDDKCWNFDIKYGKELVASSNQSDNSAIYQDIIYFTLELKQLGGVNFTQKLKEK